MSNAPTSPILQTLRVLVGAVVGALFLIAVGLLFVFGLGPPPVWVVVLLLALGVVMYALLEAVGYRVKPVSPQLPPDEAKEVAVRAFRTTLMLRLSVAELVALVGLALAFPAHTVLVYDLGAAVSVLLLAVHVWPSVRTVDRVVANLEKEGARTGLRQMLGFGGPSDGPVTRIQ